MKKSIELGCFHLAFALGAVFSAWASYRIHVIGIEEAALPMLEALINYEGRAPDQYRIIPYFLIGLIQDALNSIPSIDVALRYPVLIFDSAFLWLSVLLIRRNYSSVTNEGFSWILLLIYPFLMFDGYRPIESFILFSSIITVIIMSKVQAENSKAWVIFVLTITTLSFIRADVAFLFALCAIGTRQGNLYAKLAVFAIPLVVQMLLVYVIFPDAEYFSKLVMISDNLSFKFMIGSPLFYFFLGLLLRYRSEAGIFIHHLFKRKKPILVIISAYFVTLFVVARPNEFRLLLPLLPLILWLLEERKDEVCNDKLIPV